MQTSGLFGNMHFARQASERDERDEPGFRGHSPGAFWRDLHPAAMLLVLSHFARVACATDV